MSNYQQKELQGSLFKNDRKQTEKQPDYKGSALIDGVEYWISGWQKDKFLSLAFSRKQVQPSGDNPTSEFAKSAKHYEQKANGYQAQPDLNDDLPFA